MAKNAINLGQSKGRRTLDKVEGFATSIGVESQLKGELNSKGNCLINGFFEGDAKLEGTMVIGETGVWKGNIEANCILVAGKIEGDVIAREKMEIISTAHITGRITSSVLAIAEGAVHQGDLIMGNTDQVTQFEDKRESNS